MAQAPVPAGASPCPGKAAKRNQDRWFTEPMQPTTADEAFDDLLRHQIIQAFALTPEESEEVFSTVPGSYGAAHAEYQAEFEAFKAEIPVRAEEFAAEYTAQMVACGRLPEGVTMRWGPADG